MIQNESFDMSHMEFSFGLEYLGLICHCLETNFGIDVALRSQNIVRKVRELCLPCNQRASFP